MADYVTIYLVDFPRGMLVSQYLLGESAEVLLGQYCFIECVYVRLGQLHVQGTHVLLLVEIVAYLIQYPISFGLIEEISLFNVTLIYVILAPFQHRLERQQQVTLHMLYEHDGCQHLLKLCDRHLHISGLQVHNKLSNGEHSLNGEVVLLQRVLYLALALEQLLGNRLYG